MIEGLVRHDTEMRVEKNFVDSHGQSEVAFGFCHLLGTVRLMPRLKRIKQERLYLPAKGMVGEFPNLTGVLTRPIRGDLITQQYDEIGESRGGPQRWHGDGGGYLKAIQLLQCGASDLQGSCRGWQGREDHLPLRLSVLPRNSIRGERWASSARELELDQ